MGTSRCPFDVAMKPPCSLYYRFPSLTRLFVQANKQTNTEVTVLGPLISMTNAEPLLTSSIIYIMTQSEFFTYCMEQFAVISIQSIFIKLDFLTTFGPFYWKFHIGLERKMHWLFSSIGFSPTNTKQALYYFIIHYSYLYLPNVRFRIILILICKHSVYF